MGEAVGVVFLVSDGREWVRSSLPWGVVTLGEWFFLVSDGWEWVRPSLLWGVVTLGRGSWVA